MRALRFSLFITALLAALSLFAGSASATIRGVVLTVPTNKVTVDYTHSAGPSGPLPTLAVNGTATNNDGHVYDCDVVLNDIAFVVTSFTSSPKTTLPWNFVTAYTGQSYISITLFCDGSAVPGQTSRLKVNYVPPPSAV